MIAPFVIADLAFILAAEITEEYSLSVTDLPLIGENSLAYQSLIGNGKVIRINYFDISNPLTVPVCGRKDFQTWTIAPVITESSWVLLMETSKFIKMSEQRVSDVMVTNGYLIVQLHRSPQLRGHHHGSHALIQQMTSLQIIV